MPRPALDLSSGTKLCPKCAETKPLTEFSRSQHTKHGYQVYCKTCQYKRHNEWRRNNLAHCAANQKRHRQAKPERFADYARKQNYGLPPGEFDRLLEAQQGKCAICRAQRPGGKGRFHVDHCHNTKRIRGLLCHRCNLGIGQLNHDPAVLRAAIRYLTEAL
jgi:hypothetical protein